MDVLDQCQTVIVQLPSKSIVYEWFFKIHEFYRPIHTYVSILLCILGALCNFCNIVVLTRKQMRTPVNMILTAMACCDTVVLFSNLIYTTHYTFVAFANCHPRHWSYRWAMFLIAHAHLSLVGHSSSIWLSVMLALIRYLTLRRRGKMTGIQIDLKHSYIAIASVIIFVSVMNAPNFLTYKIMEMGLNETCIITDESVRYAYAYVPGVSDLAVEADCLVFRMAFWISGTVFKLLPCLLLTLLVSLLTRILKEVKENRQRLLLRSANNIGSNITSNASTAVTATATSTSNIGIISAVSPLMYNSEMVAIAEEKRRHSSFEILQSPTPSSPTSFCNENNDKQFKHAHVFVTTPITTNDSSLSPINPPIIANNKHPIKRSNSTKALNGNARQGRADRTTRMLLAIVCVFLITELPQGVMAVLSGMFSEEFRRYIYNNFGDILDLLSLSGACTSFIIYCSMSGQFRNEFRRVFIPTRLKRWLLSSSHYASNCDTRLCNRFSDNYLNFNKSNEIGNNKNIIEHFNEKNNFNKNNASSSTFLRPTSSFNLKCISKKHTNKLQTPLSNFEERRSISMAMNCVSDFNKNNSNDIYDKTNLNVKKLSNSAIDVTSLSLISSLDQTETQNKILNAFNFDEEYLDNMRETTRLFPFKTSTKLIDNNIINEKNNYNKHSIKKNKQLSNIPTILYSEYDDNKKYSNNIEENNSIDLTNNIENNLLNKTSSTVTTSSLSSRPNSLSSVQKFIYDSGNISNTISKDCIGQYFTKNGITNIEYKQFNNNLKKKIIRTMLKQ